jgi:hypothetical protein
MTKVADERESDATERQCSFRLATAQDAPGIVAAYERVFGVGGVKAPGHEAYPAPDVFSVEGVERILANPSKRFVIALVGDKIAGGMIIHYLSRYNCEFACVSVDLAFRGLGISPKMLAFARQIAEHSCLTINATEIVTHSIHSQTAHSRAGYNKVIGFGFCQYPRVFFSNHPESCLWIGEIQGRVARALQSEKPEHLKSGKSPDEPALTAEERELLDGLRVSRQVYVPENYASIVSAVLAQFADTLDYRILNPNATDSASAEKAQIDWADDEPFSFLKLPAGLYSAWQEDVEKAVESIQAKGKRFIQAQIPANQPSAIQYAEHLQKLGFAFLGFLPLYNFRLNELGKPHFDDLLVLQWLAPEIVATNPLPGETDSVVKLYGYPANLSGKVLKVIRRELTSNNN